MKRAVKVTNGLPVSLAKPYIAIIIMQDNVLCDGGNINNYLRLNSCMNVPQLLLQLLCLFPINRGFMYFLSNGNKTPDNISQLLNFRICFQGKIVYKSQGLLVYTVPAAVLFFSSTYLVSTIH